MEYKQENQRPEGGVYSPVEEAYRQKCVTAMVLSIVGVAIFFLPIINIAGFVLSIIGFNKSKENRAFAAANGLAENSMNTAAYVCGLIGIIIGAASILLLILGVLFFGWFTAAVITTAASTVPGALPAAASLLPLA